MRNTRINFNDTPLSIIVKLAEGNPGAATVMMDLIKESPKIDPDAALGPYAHIFDLDTLEIYGPRIWMFYKDVCKQSLVSMIAVMRAIQLGKLSKDILNHAIDNHGDGIPRIGDYPSLNSIIDTVQKELPNFAKDYIIKT